MKYIKRKLALMNTNAMSRLSMAVGLYLFATFSLFASELTAYEHSNNQLVLSRSDSTTVTLNALGNGSVEVLYTKADEEPLPGLALSETVVNNMQNTPTVLHEAPTGLMFEAPGITVTVQKKPFKLQFFRDDEMRLSEASGGFFFNAFRGVRFALSEDEKLYGGGQRVMGMNRRGQRMPLYNRASYGYTTEANQMYYGLPAVMSSNNYAVLFDNTATGNLDIGYSEKDVLQFDAVGGRLAYIVSVADSLPELVKQVVTLTGKQPLPPRWALGNFASRFGYRSEQQTREVVELYNKYAIPLDAVVLDLYWFGADLKGHMGNLHWDRNTFPTPEKMMADFAAEDVQTVVITEPFILTTSSQFESAKQHQALATNPAGEPRLYDFYFGNTGLVDVFNSKGQDWFWQHYARLIKQGVAGWWGDLGEPEVHPHDTLHQWGERKVSADEIHNAYGHQWAKLVYENTLLAQPDKRPLVLMRSGYLGSQRYGMIPWTGDVSRSWGGLKPQVELNLQMGMFGLAYTHSDLGGFAGGETFDAEMYIRWLQAGIFSPVYRPHAQENIAPEPVFHDETTRNIVKNYIQLRYDLLPYNYSLAYENSLTGMPLMRPLAFLNSGRFFEHDVSYLWGGALLVQPITDPGVTEVNMALPEGVWFDFFGSARYENTSESKQNNISYQVTLEKLPVLVKAGSFIPMQPGITRTAQSNSASLLLHYWADKTVPTAQYTLYEDDGVSPQNIAQNNFLAVTFSATHNEQSLTIKLAPKGQYKGMSKQRDVSLIVHGLNREPASASIDGKPLKWQWDANAERLLFNLQVSNTSISDLAILLK